MQNAIAVMRISSSRQDIQGDSIDHQKSQIDLYAKTHSLYIKKYFVFVESASHEQQPVQEAIDYCKNTKNDIQVFIIKSIDRFTRGGSLLYDHMKSELNKSNVRLIDIYGVISHQSVNTLEHLGVKYSWSVYTPSKKSELLEAERGKDELRDIMSRMIGAEIRYVRLGYRVRGAPFGYRNKKIDTIHGKRYILEPDPIESIWVRQMYELKAQGLLSDDQIIDHLNLRGFRTRRYYVRDLKDKNNIIGIRGGDKLNMKKFKKLLIHPIYTGIAIEKWTQNAPVKCQFAGLVSIELFNKVNLGKVLIINTNGELAILRGANIAKRRLGVKMNNEYPFKRLVLCPTCRNPFFGSASRGKAGKYYPAYHCSRRGHYYRVPVLKLHNAVSGFLNMLRIEAETAVKIRDSLSDDAKIIDSYHNERLEDIKYKIRQNSLQKQMIVEKIKMLFSAPALQALEQDLIELEAETKRLQKEQSEIEQKQNTVETESSDIITDNKFTQNILDNRPYSLRVKLFNLIFKKLPSFEDLTACTASLNRGFVKTSAG